MIKILAGTVGFKKKGRFITLTSASGAVDLGDPEREARLVKSGMAAYTDGTELSVDDGPPEGGDLYDDDRPAFNREMKLVELQEIADAYGVDASAMRTKDAVIAAIEAAIAESESDGDEDEDDGPPEGDGEQPPGLGTADPIGGEVQS